MKAIIYTTNTGSTERYAKLLALERLNRSLALYPDGFLAQFRNSMGEGGLR